MTTHKHSRPFNLEHAKAGAPLAVRDTFHEVEFVAEVPKAKSDCCLVFRMGGEITVRHINGRYSSNVDHAYDILMAPLGFVDGKPVFVGDELIGHKTGNKFTVQPGAFDLEGCHWPAPAVDYPETRMSGKDVNLIYMTTKAGDGYEDFIAIANAALRHAIDAGQVIIPSEAAPGVRPHNPYTGHRRDQLDIDSDPMGVLIHHKDEAMASGVFAKVGA